MSAAFGILARDGAARTGLLATAHGPVRTPAFMPVGTAGTVKAMHPEHVRATGADMVLANAYHLMLRPGAEQVAALGGLHRFMNWPGPILTDSGGYQVMSLARLRRLSEDGVRFQSHVDGARHVLTPERAMEVQRLLGSDVCMVLDECTPFPVSAAAAAASMELSVRWAERSRAAFCARAATGSRALLFAIVQGGMYADLRASCARRLVDLGFDGYAVGGLSVGEGQQIMLDVLRGTLEHLPEDQPRYLMGVGTPQDIVCAVAAGVDMFDCVLPTRAGRHGLAFTPQGRLNLRNACHKADERPLDPSSACPASCDYSRAYLHHLLKAREHLGAMLLTWHNLAFYQDLMAAVRTAITAGRLRDMMADPAGQARKC